MISCFACKERKRWESGLEKWLFLHASQRTGKVQQQTAWLYQSFPQGNTPSMLFIVRPRLRRKLENWMCAACFWGNWSIQIQSEVVSCSNSHNLQHTILRRDLEAKTDQFTIYPEDVDLHIRTVLDFPYKPQQSTEEQQATYREQHTYYTRNLLWTKFTASLPVREVHRPF